MIPRNSTPRLVARFCLGVCGPGQRCNKPKIMDTSDSVDYMRRLRKDDVNRFIAEKALLRRKRHSVEKSTLCRKGLRTVEPSSCHIFYVIFSFFVSDKSAARQIGHVTHRERRQLLGGRATVDLPRPSSAQEQQGRISIHSKCNFSFLNFSIFLPSIFQFFFPQFQFYFQTQFLFHALAWKRWTSIFLKWVGMPVGSSVHPSVNIFGWSYNNHHNYFVIEEFFQWPLKKYPNSYRWEKFWLES